MPIPDVLGLHRIAVVIPAWNEAEASSPLVAWAFLPPVLRLASLGVLPRSDSSAAAAAAPTAATPAPTAATPHLPPRRSVAVGVALADAAAGFLGAARGVARLVERGFTALAAVVTAPSALATAVRARRVVLAAVSATAVSTFSMADGSAGLRGPRGLAVADVAGVLRVVLVLRGARRRGVAAGVSVLGVSVSSATIRLPD